MSGLIEAIELLQATFDKYAGKEGSKDTLTKAELAELLRNEIPGAGGKPEVDNMFNMLDNDKDGVVDFTEYVTFVIGLTVLLK
ncbi:hypothetical protein PAMA_015188 [Pampus argenteus]